MRSTYGPPSTLARRLSLVFAAAALLVSLLALLTLARQDAGAGTTGQIVITEFMANPDAVLDADGEWFELYNAGAAPVNLHGWKIKDNGTDTHTINAPGGNLTISPGEFLVLARNGNTATNGSLTADYVYAGFSLGNSMDEIILLNPQDTLIDSVFYDNSAGWPLTAGSSTSLHPFSLDAVSNDSASNWCLSTAPYGSGDTGSPGFNNELCSGLPTSSPSPSPSPTPSPTPTPSAILGPPCPAETAAPGATCPPCPGFGPQGGIGVKSTCPPTPTPSPTPTATPTPTVTPTLSATPSGQTPSPTPTDTPIGQTPSPTPSGGTPTPDGTPSATPTETASPSPTQTGAAGLLHGNVNCTVPVNSIDALILLLHVAHLPITPVAGCPDIGSVLAAFGITWGDVNCDGAVNSVDALLILLFVAHLPYTLPAGCPDIGEAL